MVFFIGLLVLAALSMLFLKNIKLDNSLEVWFLKNDPALVNYNEFKELYGTDEVIMALVQSEGDVYDPSLIKRIHDLSHTLEKHQLVRRVLSITRAPYIESIGNDLIIEDMLSLDKGKEYKPDRLKKRLLSNPLWHRILLNRDSTATMIIIEPVIGKDMDESRPEILAHIQKSMKGLKYRLAGMGVVYEELNRISLNDGPLFTMLAYLILIGALFIFFRKVSILIAATGTIIFSIVIFLGIFGFLNQSFNMISIILPSLVIILCLADIIHIYAHYEKSPSGPDRLKRTLTYILVPCLFTSVTTGIGFSSLSSSPMAVLKTFGIFACVGVLLEYFVSVIITSLVLSFKEKRSLLDSSGPEDKRPDLFDRLLVMLNGFNQKRYRTVLIAGLVLMIAGAIGITRLTVDTYSIGFLLDKNQVKKDSRHIEMDYGFYVPLEVRLKPKDDEGIKSPDFLKKLSRLQERLEKNPVFDKTTSIADVVKHLNRILTDRKESSYRIPDTRNKVAQELLLYELDDDNDLTYFIDEDYTECRLTIRIPMASSRTMSKYLDAARSEINAVFGRTVKIVFGGYIPLYVKMMEYILQSQVSSFLIAFAIIFIIMAMLFRSFSVLLIGIIPNLLPIFLTLGFMGWFNINLDIATVTIAAIAIGISVDDTIHFIFMYRRNRAERKSVSESVEATLLTAGKAIIITSMLLIFGYLIMIFASVKSVIFMGLLIAVTMLSALLCDMLLLPSLLLLLGKREEAES